MKSDGVSAAAPVQGPAVKGNKPKPVLAPEYCKGCGRCLDACAHHCLTPGSAIHPGTGLIPIAMQLDLCTGCGLCAEACPEPYGLLMETRAVPKPAAMSPAPAEPADQDIPLPALQPLAMKGTYASAIGGILAGCRHVFGYPITPSTEGTELMAKLLPQLDGVFFQTVSEVATINMLYGAGGAGVRSMTFTASPGFSLMLEGLSYMIGADVPAVVVNVMRGGPGLGNIGPEQADIKLACRGLGHGNTHAVVLAPSTPQEMLDLTRLAFTIAFQYRTPVIVLADGFLGQMTGRVTLPSSMVKPALPSWGVYGDAAHRKNLITSFYLSEPDLEARNRLLNDKYARMQAEARADITGGTDAEILVVAANSPAQTALGVVNALRRNGEKVGLFRPVTLWPFPIEALRPLLPRVKRFVVVEASAGQLEDELRLALSHAGAEMKPITAVRRYGGLMPTADAIRQGIAGKDSR